MTSAIYITVVVVATAGLVYELVAAAAASYSAGRLDHAVLHGHRRLPVRRWASARSSRAGCSAAWPPASCRVELLVGADRGLGGDACSSSPSARPRTSASVLYGVVGVVGVLVGLEIPLLLRLLRGRLVFRELVAQVLSLDYVGALAASILFPLLLVPRLGLIRTSLLVGLANAAVGLWSTWIFRRDLPAVGRCARSGWWPCWRWAPAW